jgi:serine kinase of HPr protein (carbohydrate metabolism regulator)
MIQYLQSLDCIAFGVRFRLQADSERLLERMLQCAPFSTQPCATPAADPQQFALFSPEANAAWRLFIGDRLAFESRDDQSALAELTRELMVHIANYAPDLVFVHAGVVGWKGHALVLPGTSFAGKTTLVAELVRAGATYYSDEYAVLDDQGRVHPYSRDLQMRENGSHEQTSVAIEVLNGNAGTAPRPVSHVVFTEYLPSAQWSPEPVSAGLAVLEMLRHTIPVQRTPARVMATLAKMMETATAVRSERGEAAETARALLQTMDDQDARPV